MSSNNQIFDFLGKFRNGIAMTNRYRVEFYLPRGVSLGENELGVNQEALAGRITGMQNLFNSLQQIDVKCHTAVMPGRTLSTFEHRINSAPWKIPFSAEYGPASFSFYGDGGMDTRDFWDVWQSAVNNHPTNTMNFPEEYVSDVKITALDRMGRDTYSVTLFEAWPMDISEVALSYTDMDTPTVTTVTLAYAYWQPKWSSNARRGNST